MAEAVAKESVCTSCGADIRPDSLFCYACGGSLEAELAAIEKEKASDAWLRSDLQEEIVEEKAESDLEDPVVEIDPEEVAQIQEEDEQSADNEGAQKTERIEVKAKSQKTETDVSENKEFKTAASLRKKPKKFRNKRVEVVWEEHESSPNILFIVGAGILTIIGAVLFYLAMYLK
ncbi:MAG: hypothetical protein HKN25_15235 [Pyrinomonadaceae bacterium]|nr:hypothetical protein [Pyrinomonadaceae bacterium]